MEPAAKGSTRALNAFPREHTGAGTKVPWARIAFGRPSGCPSAPLHDQGAEHVEGGAAVAPHRVDVGALGDLVPRDQRPGLGTRGRIAGEEAPERLVAVARHAAAAEQLLVVAGGER